MITLSEDGYSIKGIAPPDLRDRPEFALTFWGWVVDLGLRAKDNELSRGLDKNGKPLRRITEATRLHRRSAMTPTGKGDPSAPPLMPGRQLSRTRSLLTGRAYPDHAAFWWKFDPWTGQSWARVLDIQRDLYGRDVYGISPKAEAAVKVKAWARWEDLKAGRPIPVITARQTAPVVIPQIGRVPTAAAVFGVGGAPRGEFTGGMTRKEWEAYFRAPAKVKIPSRPGDDYNVILRHIWGAPGGPAKAVAIIPRPPKPKPVVIRVAMAPAPPKPPPPPPKPPTTMPMSAALGLPSGHPAADEIRASVAAIEQVHRVANLSKIPVGLDAKIDEVGAFYLEGPHKGQPAKALRIAIDPNGDHVRTTMTHELGHFIEGFAIPDGNGGDRDWDKEKLLKPWMEAIKTSKAWQGLDSLVGKTKTTIPNPFGAGTATVDIEPEMIEYYLRWDEIWARAYAQYIGLRAGDRQIQDQIFRDASPAMNLRYHNAQWRTDDFEPIARAMDDLFRGLQWTK